MLDRETADRIAQEWVDAWNRHDVDAVVAHFADDVVVTSPVAAALGVAEDGKVRGKQAVREYYARGIANAPSLHFDLDAVLAGVDGITVLYRNHRGQQVAEIMVLDDEIVQRVMVHYGPADLRRQR
jgi:hypothetical protein